MALARRLAGGLSVQALIPVYRGDKVAGVSISEAYEFFGGEAVTSRLTDDEQFAVCSPFAKPMHTRYIIDSWWQVRCGKDADGASGGVCQKEAPWS
jgi:hypothetical protein